MPYAIFNLEDRGKFFIGAGEQVYNGMILGEHSRDNDLEVNPLKGKKLTNVRASGNDEAVRLTTPVRLTLEQAIAYIEDDELVEVTPRHIRLRKRYLDPHERKRQSRHDGRVGFSIRAKRDSHFAKRLCISRLGCSRRRCAYGGTRALIVRIERKVSGRLPLIERG